jgi:LPXTG-motif cell wall-anchored protein
MVAVVTAVLLMTMMTASAFAATTYIVKDGAFQNSGFVNAGEAADGSIQGPGNWTQLNLGDAAVDAPYLHVIIKAEGGDTAAAQIGVSDLYTFNLSDLGVTLTEEYQDVVLPVEDNGITSLSWMNCMGLDGGTVTYTIKDVFLSDDANSSLAASVEDTATTTTSTDTASDTTADTDATTQTPQTGESQMAVYALLTGMAVCFTGYVLLKKKERV